ncbi:MAG: patatin-like phospholipase family protein [Hyphomonadaceae bacterium]|nr:patatin-like phospholipase family protein [Hyphomonadaceae bacterium]
MSARKRINLALQGGGALGAFTWGVLDHIVEDGRLEIEAISGASAGAMNAVVFCAGFTSGGADGARAALRSFWEGVAKAGEASPYRRTPMQAMMLASLGPLGEALTGSWAAWWGALAGATSPYDANPLNLNPVGDLLEELVDFDHVRRCTAIQLYIAATHVETGRVRIFTNPEMTARHVLASACLPQVFQAVEIDGAHYWDGGFMGNPPLFPLYDRPRSRDILIVQINPVERPEPPRSAADIAARVNEITFNASLLRDLRAIEFVSRLLDEGRLEEGRYRRMLIHVVSDDAALAPLGAGAKLNTDMGFFEQLFAFGRAACARWLEAHYDDLGVRGTVDLRAMFEGEVGPRGAPARSRARPE